MPRRVRLVKTLSGTRAQPVVFSPHCWQGCLGQVCTFFGKVTDHDHLCVALGLPGRTRSPWRISFHKYLKYGLYHATVGFDTFAAANPTKENPNGLEDN